MPAVCLRAAMFVGSSTSQPPAAMKGLMERRQIFAGLAAACITVGGAAAIASFNSSVSDAVRPLLRAGGTVSLLLGVAALLALLATAKNKAPPAPELRPGRGGNATVSGSGLAKGGAGGAPGGGDGGSAYVGGDGIALGGEAGQAERGGRNPLQANGGPNAQMPDGTWIWDYGRGGGPAVRLVLRPDVEISEAVAYAFFREWGRTFEEAVRRTSASIDDVLALVNRRLLTGELSIWGRAGMEWTLLEPNALPDGLERASLLAGRGQIEGRTGEFDELLVSGQQFEILWPKYFERGAAWHDPGLNALFDWRPTN